MRWWAAVVLLLVTTGWAGCAGGGEQAARRTPTTSRPSTTSAPTTTTEPATTTTAVPAPPVTAASAGRRFPAIPRPGEPVAPTDPEALAGQIVSTEAALADPATPPDQLARHAHVQQVAYRLLVNRSDLRAATFAALPASIRPAAEANVGAGALLRSMLKKPKEELPPWRIVDPASPAELRGYYDEAEATNGVPWNVLAAIHLVETRMGRIRGTSDAGAQGPMQFMPATWSAYGEGGDIQSNRDSILAASRYLKRNGAPGDLRNAVWNYNHDFRYVDAVLAYADRMKADERGYLGYHGWQVYYVTVVGDVWLPVGYAG